MRVLLLETRSGIANDAAEQLAVHGHTVVRCHERGRRVFPCNALVDGAQCPLADDRRPVDVALTIRHQASPLPVPLEDGIACALRAHVPVVVAGEAASNPYQPFGAVEAGDDVVAACEAASTATLERHGAIALEAFARSLECLGVTDPGARATVHRNRGGLRVVISLSVPVDESVLPLATTRVVGALRAFDRVAPTIDVSVERA